VVVEGRLVPIGGGRSLFIDCVGSGRPTVVLEAGFGGDTNRVSILTPTAAPETLPLMSKAAVADAILDRVGPLLSGR
jgi:hypothetical protein